MSHRLYYTDGFVLEATPIGESHMLLLLLTAEFGAVRAMVRSAREERSKLRYHTQRYTFARFNLVRGRDVWRVVGVASGDRTPSFDSNRGRRATLARVASLLKRLLPGEEKDAPLFALVKEFGDFLSRKGLADSYVHNAECITVLRILHVLGYVAQTAELQPLLACTALDDEVIEQASAIRTQAVRTINQSLAASHL